ncbi:hypothetical protein HYU23_02225 [Candidatus Woesearchaeota archaeon]|nr:hypothetical protein [Candidatus Woesearchaeota archaeon]
MVVNDKMTVMQVRPNYSIVYQFKPILKLERRHVKSQKNFVDFIKEISTNWKDGDYFLKSTKGTFAYFNLNGSRVKLFKKSKMGKDYICWEYFGPIGSIAKKVSNVRRK